MQRLKKTWTASLTALGVVGFVLYIASGVHAQLLGGNGIQKQIEGGSNIKASNRAFCILQNDLFVGEVYVPPRLPDQTTYVEHWVLFAEYVYPNPTNGQVLHVEACDEAGVYESVEDFFTNVPWGEGSRYIHVTSHESTHLPG